MKQSQEKEPGKLQMSKVSAIAFVAVLIFVVVAGYLIYTNIRDDLQGPETVTPRVEQSPTVVVVVEEITDTPVLPTETPLPVGTATLEPSATVTEVIPTTTLSPTSPPAGPTIQVVTPTKLPTVTPRPGTETPTTTESASPTAVPTSTATPSSQYTFHLDGGVVHDFETSCVAQYIRGMVWNKAGDPLEGVRFKAYDLWGNEVVTTSKGGAEAGKWDIVLGGTENIWKVVLLDAAGIEISPVAVVPHHQEDEFKDACIHIVNWRRVW